jgi:hypothetical protein
VHYFAADVMNRLQERFIGEYKSQKGHSQQNEYDAGVVPLIK